MNLDDTIKILRADHEIGTTELQQKLQKLLNDRYNPVQYQDGVVVSADPANYLYILDVYLFENYVIFSQKSEYWKQAFLLDPVLQTVALLGDAEKVVQKFAPAPSLQARNVSKKERKSLAKKEKALPDGSFPIANKKDLGNAKQAVGRAKDKSKARAFINKRAKQLGAEPLSAGGPGSGRHATKGVFDRPPKKMPKDPVHNGAHKKLTKERLPL